MYINIYKFKNNNNNMMTRASAVARTHTGFRPVDRYMMQQNIKLWYYSPYAYEVSLKHEISIKWSYLLI